EWHSLWLADPSFVGVLFQQAQASEAAAAPIPCLSCRLQSEGRRADIAGECFQSKAWCSPSNLANPTESHPTEITHLFFGQALRMAYGLARGVGQQILFGDIGDVFSLRVFRE